MNLNEYQEKAKKTDLHTKVEANELDYYLLGLTSEVGEVAGRMKRVYRDQKGKISLVEKERIKKELGDHIIVNQSLSIPLTANMEVLSNQLTELLNN